MPQFHINKYFGSESLLIEDFHLVQIGRLYFAPLDFIKPHKQGDWFELTIVTDGEGSIFANGVATTVTRGSIFLSLPSDIHEIRSSRDAPLKYDFLCFYTDNEKYSDALKKLSACLTPDNRVFSDERISALVCDAIMELINARDYSNELLYAIFNQIVIYIIRDFEFGFTVDRKRNASQAEGICYRIMNYIDTHIYTMQGLSDLADAMQYNYSYLSDLFCKVTSDTLLHYYRTRRLEAAKLLLSEGKLSVGEIADLLHYASIYTFSRAFKEAFGTSPAQYRKRASKSE